LFLKTNNLGNVEKEKLFQEFPPVSTEAWEKVIEADLKGADYEKKLVWNTNEGIKVKPYYRAEDIQHLLHINVNPNEFPYVRGNKADNSWEIRQDIQVHDLSEANKQALEAVERGATALGIIPHGKIKTAADFSSLVKGIHFGCINFNLQSCRSGNVVFDFVVSEAKNQGYDLSAMEGSVTFDPLTVLTNSGNFIANEKADFETLKALVEKAKATMPKYKVIGVNGSNVQESGGTIVQELAYTLAQANEYLGRLTDLGLSVDDITPRMQFIFATGANYFFEIAKIRAFRLMWANVVEAYNPKNKEVAKAFIHCNTAKINMTVFDPYVNMLRGTTESMSAVIGGADSVSVRPFDAPYKQASSFSNRIARNTQIILKEEAYLDTVADPAAGSYYIESLTDSIAAEAWKLFQKVEAEGGYIAAFKAGSIQAEIEAVAKKRLANVSSRRDTILGTNQYPNFSEFMLKNMEADNACCCTAEGTPAMKPLRKMRLSEQIEALRLTTERSGKRPKVFMLTIGNLAMRLARSQFSCNFFAIAGFEVIDNNGFKTVEEGINAALAAKADIIVLCSSDDEYATLAPEAFDKLAAKALFVVAGAPACTDELKAKGIINFISMKSNLLETLADYQKQLKIV
jgi:methylmalonyl-CoA mutase